MTTEASTSTRWQPRDDDDEKEEEEEEEKVVTAEARAQEEEENTQKLQTAIYRRNSLSYTVDDGKRGFEKKEQIPRKEMNE